MTYKNVMAGLGLLLILGLAIWTTLISYCPPIQEIKTDDFADAFMEDVKAIIMDKQGKPKIKNCYS